MSIAERQVVILQLSPWQVEWLGRAALLGSGYVRGCDAPELIERVQLVLASAAANPTVARDLEDLMRKFSALA